MVISAQREPEATANKKQVFKFIYYILKKLLQSNLTDHQLAKTN